MTEPTFDRRLVLGGAAVLSAALATKAGAQPAAPPMGKALGGGSGWVILTWSHRDQRLVNQWAADPTMSLADSTPILVLDMYEHAYAIDYGAKAGAYVDAFMAAINWAVVATRLAKATA